MGGPVAVQTTVVIPVWDAYVATRLIDAVSSLRTQEVPARIVVVDNASHVAIPVLPGVTTVRSRERLSLGSARNLGLARVSTPYVIFWDADDVMLPGTLASLEAAIEADPRLVAFGEAIFEEPPGRRHRWPRPWIAGLLRRPRLFALLDCVWSLYPTTGATIIRTEAARAAGGFADSDSGEDWCLGAALAFRGRLGWSERPGRVYHLHHESMWARHMTLRHQLRHAATLRARLGEDRGVPEWVRSALPLIRTGQYTALLTHELVARARRLTGTRR